MSDLPLCPQCPAWGGASVGSESHRSLTGPEGWGWTGNMLQAHGAPGIGSWSVSWWALWTEGAFCVQLALGPWEGNHVEVGTPL